MRKPSGEKNNHGFVDAMDDFAPALMGTLLVNKGNHPQIA